MKIAFVYDAVYPWVKGGVERRIYEVGRRLANRHEVHWFGLKWWSDCMEELDGILLHGLGERKELYVKGRRSIDEAIYFGLKALMGLGGSFDLIDSQAFPYFSCFSTKIHSIVRRFILAITWHELWEKYWFEYLGMKGLIGWVVERATSKLTNKNIAVSNMTRRSLERIGVKAEVIPNGIDVERIRNVKRSTEEYDIIFAGRLIKEKNVDLLIKAIKILKESIPDVKCVIIGNGPEGKELKSLSKYLKLNSNIVFKGFLEDHDDVISYMKASKVFVLPSTREGFGIAALEANACGLPVITVKHERNATCDLITQDINGFICSTSPKMIAEKILEAMQRDMRDGCIKNAMEYDWRKIIQLYENFLTSLGNKRRV
ncbi:MAG: glycosyltransferase family 4 protein [Thermoproteota archaeon]